MKVAFQGEKGAYSEMAAYQFFGNDIEAIGFEHSEQVCEALEKKEVATAILPVENSIVGNVTVNLDLLYKHDFFITGETYLKIEHCLLAPRGVKINDIKKVHSHPIALAQCRDFLNRHSMQAIPDYDTAGASKEMVRRGLSDEATISSKLCAQYYDLEIVSDDIQKVKNNLTRFVVFNNSQDIPEGINQEKTSIAFITKHHPGALLNCLKEFSNHGLNLTKIESRPIPENPFAYIFFVDFIGALNDSNTKDCLMELKSDTERVKILGCYPAGIKNH